MFERPRSGERTALVHITINSEFEQPGLDEFAELARSAGAIVVTKLLGSRQRPDPAHFIGKGKLEELKALVTADEIEVVLFNHSLSPAQERNLERALSCRVLDRTGVILDIFAQRARSFEGKLQVELAQLEHLSTRLVRGWTHLERQKGGIGLRGPGETQLETDRRLLSVRIEQLKKRLEKVTQQRTQSRRARQRAELPIVSLVGYTNAGKSTLFNSLTNAGVYAADQLFATLDATFRRVDLPEKNSLILVDTVGFVQHLPHDLVAAFRATLDETREADLLLHIVDASDPQRQLRIAQVNEVLKEIGADSVPQILVYNKIDRLPAEEGQLPRVERDSTTHNIYKVWLSAVTGQGLPELLAALKEFLQADVTQCWLHLPVNAGQMRAQVFEQATVLQEVYASNGDSLLEIRMPTHHFYQLQHHTALIAYGSQQAAANSNHLVIE
jgi:GTP-binding protein HflX